MTAGKVGRGVGKTVKWAAIIGVLVIVVIVIVALVSLGGAADESERSSREVTPAEFTRIQTGATPEQVRAIIGAEPERTDETTIEGLTMNCWYYGILAQSGTYQFCFQNGRLSSKSRI